ncbi:CotH kinase family protein [bacterium]|nr:CotH kinase family protein [bacterium]
MRFLILILFLIIAPQLHAQEADSTDMLFDQQVVHTWNLHFYVEGYEDSLRYNYENGEEYMPARLEYNGLVFDSVGVRYKGNSSYQMSRGTPKKPLKFKFDKYKDDQTCYGVKKLNFSNCVKDPSFVREMLAYGVIGAYIPASRSAYAAIEIDGELLGLYVQVEQVDKTFLKRHYEDNDFNLYKASDDGATLEYRGSTADDYREELELQTNEKEDDWSRLITMLDLLNNEADASFYSTLEGWLNYESVTHLLAFNMVLSNFDSYSGSGRNFYLYDDEITGQFNILPWDLNEAFGAYSNSWDIVRQDVFNISNLDRRPLNRRILENPQLFAAYIRAIRAMIDGPASIDSLAVRAAQYRTLIDPYVAADENKLYSYEAFLDNLSEEVVVGLGMRIPAVLGLMQARIVELRAQLDVYTAVERLEGSATRFSLNGIWPYPLRDHGTFQVQSLDGGLLTLRLVDALGRTVYQRQVMMQSGVQTYPLDVAAFTVGWYVLHLQLQEESGSIELVQRPILIQH